MTTYKREYPILIIGGGLCGLSAAYYLEAGGHKEYLLLEQNDEIGGLARTETHDGFSFDHSIHILFTQKPRIRDLICNKLLVGNIRAQKRESHCFTEGVFTEYPYQAHNYGLPPDVIMENIIGLINAHYEPTSKNAASNFEEWLYKTFGCGIAENFMIPYNRRQWAWDLKDMSYDWIAGRVPMPEIREVLEGALKPPQKKYGPNQEFMYPIKGGIEALAQAFARNIPKERILLSAKVANIDPHKRYIILENKERISYNWLISTMPVPRLIHIFTDKVPKEIKTCAKGLKNNIVHTVNIGLEGAHIGIDKFMHWVYFSGKDTIFHRISFPHRFSEKMVPADCCSIQAEISESVYKPCDKKMLIKDTLDGLVRIGFLEERDKRSVAEGGRIRTINVSTLNPAYIIYDLKHKENVNTIKSYLESINIQTAGRFGKWEYFNMDHAVTDGKETAEKILGHNKF
jgi:protoporphyrinogen oxidase